MLYSTVLVALLAAIYVYYLTKKRFMLVVILGQLFCYFEPEILLKQEHTLKSRQHALKVGSILFTVGDILLK